MLSNDSLIASVLEQGGTVVVPSRQRAVAVGLAHTAAQLARGARTWPSCDVLPWAAWLQRMAMLAHPPRHGQPRRLGAAEEWLAWRAAADAACEGAGLLDAGALADALRRAAALQRDGDWHWPGTPGAEAGVLARARAAIEQHCRSLQAVSGDDWRHGLDGAPPATTPLLFAGFDPPPGAALVARLRELGARFSPDPDGAHIVDAGTADARTAAAAAGGDRVAAAGARADAVIACADRRDELRRAAQWCRDRLAADPSARLLVVVPQLATWRAAATQCFEHALHGATLCAATVVEPLFAIEGGSPLADYPLVATAQSLLNLATRPLEFPELAALLRSPYLEAGAQDLRARFERELRERNVPAATLPQLRALALQAGGPLAEHLAPAWLALEPHFTGTRTDREDAAAWARLFAARLEAAGWPGKALLGSDEQQQRERYELLLGEFAALGDAAGRLDQGEAVALLAGMAARTAFEPASDDAPVTLTAATGDPLVHYDGIWVAGLVAEDWPPAARPDPFIPYAVQRAGGLATATAAGQLALAQRMLVCWRHRARELVLSWPRFEGDAPLQPGSLLQVSASVDPPATAADDPLTSALHVGARLEQRPADRLPPWPADRLLPGGTRALSLQSDCPFRAAAELRLGARPLPEPLPGLDVRERGMLLHAALESLWRRLGDSRTLQAAAAGTLQGLVVDCVDRALASTLRNRAHPLPSILLEIERERAGALILALLEQERQRPPFSVQQVEQGEVHRLGGQPLRVRMDRVDRLDDGRVVIIDYKSGRPQAFDRDEQRPAQPQLLAYALLAPAPLAAVAAVHLSADGVGWRGAAADAAILPALPRPHAPAPAWEQLLEQWRRVIDALVAGFVAGETAVHPRPGACRNCHLPMLCRIDESRRAMAEDEGDSAGEGEGEGEPGSGTPAAAGVADER